MKKDAWVIDFIGGYNSHFVDEDVMETVEGSTGSWTATAS